MAVAQQEIEQAEALAQQGNSDVAIALLSQLIQRDARNIAAWLALSDVVDEPERVEYCLQKVLNLDPGNAAALAKLSKTKGGSLSVGSMGGLNHSDSPSGNDPALAAHSEVSQDADSDETARSGPVPANPQAFSEEPEQQDELPAPEYPADASSLDAAGLEGSQDHEVQLAAAPATPEYPTEASRVGATGLEGSKGHEVQFATAPAAPEESAQGLAGRFSIGRTDLILIGLTLLAGIVLCALVSAALIR